jgi:transposase-like protein/molybdenum-dependent DNA-binding transcriptional regulator ModE
MFNNLRELVTSMPDEKTCREYLIKERWNGVIVCPHCNNEGAYVIEGGKKFKCKSKACHKKFSVTVGTIMEASNIPLTKWLTAIYLVTAHKKGISSYQLGRDLGIAQKNAWFMLHRIREMLRTKKTNKLDNVVEVDEVYIGGKVGNMSKTKRAKLRAAGNTYGTKTMVMGMLERNGELKLIPVSSNNGNAIQSTVKDNINKEAFVITDGHESYKGLDKEYTRHEVVNHSGQEYVREGNIHTNSIEGAFSLLKRSIIGIYHQVTPKHLDRYCDETMFRYNLREMKDKDRFVYSLSQIEGRLTYKELIADKSTIVYPKKITYKKVEINKKNRAVIQMKKGEEIGRYDSITGAAKANGMTYSNIQNAIKRGNRAGGFNWIYA